MPKKGVNISLKGYDDIFSTEQSRTEEQQERVQEIPLSELHPFEGHPFKVVDDEAMMKTAESVRDFGIPVPDYIEENVSSKVVKIIQSYTGVVNKMVWRKEV